MDYCLLISSLLKTSSQKIIHTNYFSHNFVISIVLDKTIVFLPDTNMQYEVDVEKQQLKRIDLSNQLLQMNQFKVNIGAITEERQAYKDGQMIKIFSSKDANIMLEAEMLVKKHPLLAKTCNDQFINFNRQLQIYTPELNTDEFVADATTKLFFNNQEQIIKMSLLKIEETPEKFAAFNKFLNFEIVN